MILAWLLLLTGLTISAVAIYYSVVGLTAIFAAAAIPIIVMGSALEIAKLVCATWLKANWTRTPILLKAYMSSAVVVLMIITSMGIFGFLSKAHSDQSLVSGDVLSRISVYDEKIKIAKENVDANRKALKQMDEAVDQVMGRSTSETGADKAVGIRRSQQKERSRLQSEIASEQKTITQLNEERAPIAAEVRKVEAEVGPIKYIAAFVYGDTNESVLEKAVTWVIIMIVIVFDPLAVIMLLAAQMTFAWLRENVEPVIAAYEPDDTPLTDERVARMREVVAQAFPANMPKYEIIEELDEEEAAMSPEPEVDLPSESELEQWNRMIAEAEREVAKTNAYSTIADRLARGESFVNSEGNEETFENDGVNEEEFLEDFDENLAKGHETESPILTLGIDEVERPGDYLTEEESKKKTYMIKDPEGKVSVKSRE